MVERLSKVTMNEDSNLASFNDLKILSQYDSTQFLLVKKDGKISYGSAELRGQLIDDVLLNVKGREEIIYKEFEVQGVLSKRMERLVLYTTVSEINAINRVVFRGGLIALIFTSLVTLLIGYLMQKRLTKPVKEIKGAIEAYKKDKTVRPDIKTKDEFEVLGDDLNQLMNQVNEANERQKIFFQNASHELKTPLMSIQGYAEAIKDGVVSEDERDASLNIIISESQRLKRIVEEMILLTKLDDVGEKFDFKMCSLVEIFDNAVMAVKPILTSEGVKLVKNIDEDVIGLFDSEKMTRVFINLLSNSARYAKSKVTVSIQKKGHLIYVDLMDDGSGFEVGSEELLFDRFYKGETGGSGIGLALTKTIVERHGGTINAVNNVGMGALFKMTFKAGDIS